MWGVDTATSASIVVHSTDGPSGAEKVEARPAAHQADRRHLVVVVQVAHDLPAKRLGQHDRYEVGIETDPDDHLLQSPREAAPVHRSTVHRWNRLQPAAAATRARRPA